MSDDKAAILRLMNEYCYRIDACDKQGFAELFEHGTFVLKGDPDGGLSGAEAMMTMLQNVTEYDGKTLAKHIMSNIQIDVDPSGNTASAQCYITVMQGVPPDFPLQAIFIGHYFDSFEKVDGNWRFVKREISPDLIGDLSHHRADMA